MNINKHAFSLFFLLLQISLLVTVNDATCQSSSNKTGQKAISPKKTISGKVINAANGAPLEGVSVHGKRGKVKTITKADGTFSIEVADEVTSLEFTSVGFETTTVSVNNQSSVSVQLKEQSSDLSEVVVVAYGTQKKETYTGAASTINRQVIEDESRTSFEESLQGNATGVYSSNGSGQPGSAPSIRIRGVGSIGAFAGPLYVIDGIPMVSGDISNGLNSNAMAAVNPNDIASIAVLKDASATALYGSRGANGVILVATKKGKATDKTNLNVRVQTGVNFYSLNGKKYRPLTTLEMLTYLREGWANNPDFASRSFDSALVQAKIDTTVNTNWINEILRVGKYTNLQLNATGGSEKTSFYISGSLSQNNGVEKSLNHQKITAMFNLSHRVSNKFSFNFGLSLAQQIGNNTVIGSINANPIKAMYKLQSWLPIYNTDGSYRTDYYNANNPVGILNNNIRRATTYFVRGFTNGFYKFNNHLSYEVNVGLDFSHAFNLIYQDNRFGNKNVATNGYIENYSGDISNWIVTNILRYKNNFNRYHSLETFAGYETSGITNTYINPSGTELSADGASAAVPNQTAQGKVSSGLVSQFLNSVYTYRNRYFISGSIRNDESSKFSPSKQNAIFWSVGAGWEVTKERFFHVNPITSLKIRGSYGATGNSLGLSEYGYQSLYNTTSSYDNQSGITFSQVGNNSLTWEKNYPLNIGLDAAFLKNRLALVFDWYTRKTSDLIINYHAPAVNGVSFYSGNFGSIRNTGFEVKVVSVNIKPIKPDGFKWTTEASFSTNQNTILQIDRLSTSSNYIRKVGVDYYQWYIESYAGVDSANGKALWFSDSAKTKTTNKYAGAIAQQQGSAMPKFFGSVTNIFNYKGFSLFVQLFYNWGNKIYNTNGPGVSSDGSAGFSAIGNINIYNYEHRWRKPGDVTDVPAPVIYGTQTGLSGQSSTRFLYDGSYIRLRDVMISYKLPDRLVAKARLSSVSIYARANNLLTYVKDKRLPYDPETGIDGTLNQRPPIYRTVLVGTNINF